MNSPDGFPSAWPPVWWIGGDSGGGAAPIGPNGPYSDGYGYGGGWSCATFAPAVPAVIRATALITGPLTAAPFGVKDTTGGRQPQERPRWLTDPMLTRPDDRIGGQMYPAVQRLGRAGFWTEWLRSAIWHGEGAFICTEDNTGQPVPGTMRVIHPDALETERDPATDALHWVLAPATASERVVFDRDGYVTVGAVRLRIVVLRNPHSPVDVDGRSRGVFELSPSTFRLGGQLAGYQSGQFRSGVPNGYLKVTSPDLEQSEATDLKRRWMDAHGGDRRSIAVLNATTDFQPLNLSPVDSGLDQVKRLNLADVAFAFGIDPATLGASLSTSNTYSNIRDAWQNHKDFGLAPWIAAAQDTLSALLPTGQEVAVSLDGVANPSMRDRFDAYKVAIDAGILTLEEVRALEALPPRGDEAA